MAQQITTIQTILSNLNGGPTGPWIPIDGVYTSDEANIDSDNKITSAGQLLVQKKFINTQTGEIKSYLSKWTNELKTQNLP